MEAVDLGMWEGMPGYIYFAGEGDQRAYNHHQYRRSMMSESDHQKGGGVYQMYRTRPGVPKTRKQKRIKYWRKKRLRMMLSKKPAR